MATPGRPLTAEERALVVAMDLLRKSLGDTTIATAANTQATEDDMRKRAESARAFVQGAPPGEGAFGASFGEPAADPYKFRRKPKLGDDPGPGGIETEENKKARQAKQAAEAAAEKARGAAMGRAIQQSPLFGVLAQVGQKFASIIGPSAILAQVLNSNVSGMGTLQTSVKVLASSIAPVLLPITLRLSGAFLAVSESLSEHGGLIDKVFDDVEAVMPVIELLIGGFDNLLDQVDEADKTFQESKRAILEFVEAAYLAANKLNPFTSEDEDREKIRSQLGSATERELAVGKDKTDRGTRDALQSLRNSIGPKAQISGLGEVGRQVQLAALNADPLEVRLQKQQLDALNRIEKKLPGRSPPGRAFDPGEGEFSGGTGSGGGEGDF